jgi:MarR family transcriptional regulator, organic hydroperoxide resistance regulator
MTTPHPEEREKTIDRLLAEISHLHYSRHVQRFDAFGLHRGQTFVLRVLWEQEGLTQTRLAERLDIKPATATKMLQRMEKAGFIDRKPDSSDQRLSRVYLTEKGRTFQNKIENLFKEMNAEVIDGLSPDEQTLLRHLLLKVRKNLQDTTGEKPPSSQGGDSQPQ